MSSAYRVLCLSHDPALVLETEWRSAEDALTAIADPSLCHEIATEHRACDLVVGAYSYPLYKLWCPPSRAHPDGRDVGHRGFHPHNPDEVDAYWLTLLWHAYQAPEGSSLRPLTQRAPGCWPAERVHRLRHELRVED